jgi:hypothetical protein
MEGEDPCGGGGGGGYMDIVIGMAIDIAMGMPPFLCGGGGGGAEDILPSYCAVVYGPGARPPPRLLLLL